LILKSQITNFTIQPCDLCGSIESGFILASPRLDGPLVQCRDCNLYYVIVPEKAPLERAIEPDPERSNSKRVASEMERLSRLARELALVDAQVEESERPWRELMARERLDDLKRFVISGRLLEVGCSTGELIEVAGSSFTATGVEADARSSHVAIARGLDCFNGTLADARFPGEHFDVAAMYHVIEHFRSPRAELLELHRVIKPGGWMAIETPNIETLWFRLLGARWRQFIPDHIFFFTPQTITRLCEECGFEVHDLRNVGKAMSLRLFINRLSRYHRPTAKLLEAAANRLNLGDRTLRLNLGDVMRLYAKRR
jgi:2-polyprenyl-3-methyl-5-hydroxy-6-metoxy-1,4-benzoquinol methylase